MCCSSTMLLNNYHKLINQYIYMLYVYLWVDMMFYTYYVLHYFMISLNEDSRITWINIPTERAKDEHNKRLCNRHKM